MIPSAKSHAVISSGVTASASFDISSKDAAHIMTILRDTLYSDKVMAVLREYSANAWDAHRMVGRGDRPIKVVIPTFPDPILTIRDFGPGLSEEEVFTIFAQYGSSTKRESNDGVGMLGIGSKSGFAYTDSFTLTSWKDGIHCIYSAVIDESEKGSMNLVYKGDCALEETGVEIQIAVRRDDVNEFQQKAAQLYQYFEPRPDINIALPAKPAMRQALKNGAIYEKANEHAGGSWVAVMGCVAYRIDPSQIRSWGSDVPDYVMRNDGEVFFDIGTIDVNASREALKYSPKTKAALTEKFAELVDEVVAYMLRDVHKDEITDWERRLRIRDVAALHLPITANLTTLASDTIKIPLDKLKHVQFNHGADGSLCTWFAVSRKSRLLTRDDASRKLKGYCFEAGTYLYSPKRVDVPVPDDKKDEPRYRPETRVSTWEECETELAGFLAESRIEGIPRGKLSEQPWTQLDYRSGVSPGMRKKHSATVMVLKPDRDNHYHPLSDAWDVATVETSPNDVYVIIEKFKVALEERWGYGTTFYKHFVEDRRMMRDFGGGRAMPPIYGYKNTAKAKLDPAKIEGTPYSAWRKEFHESIRTAPVNLSLLEHWAWLSETNLGLSVNDFGDTTLFDGDAPDRDDEDEEEDEVEEEETASEGAGDGQAAIFALIHPPSAPPPEKKPELPKYVAGALAAIERLPDGNLIRTLLERQMEAGRILCKLSSSQKVNLGALRDLVYPSQKRVANPEIKKLDAAIRSRYPLVGHGPGLSALWNQHSKAWWEYVELIEGSKKRKRTKTQ